MAESTPERIPSLLRLLAEALDARRGTDHPQAGAMLFEFGQLARLQIPIRGALPLSDDELFNEIDTIAIKHLDLAGVRKALDVALTRVDPLATRDEIEVAVDHLSAVLNVAYFHAGLAFGVALADLKSL